MPKPLVAIGNTIHLDQGWSMFAPSVLARSGWFVIPGKLKDGTEVDLYRHGAPVSWAKPPDILSTFRTERWREYLTVTYIFGSYKPFWPFYADYLCRTWNAHHANEKQLQSLRVVFMFKTTQGTDAVINVYHQKIMLTQQCIHSPRNVNRRAPIPWVDQNTRQPKFTGSFYPADAQSLRETVDRLISNAIPSRLPGSLVALVVPHASYMNSGTIAGNGYKCLDNDWETVILLGPSHHVAVKGAALWARGKFLTPLGRVPIDEALAAKLLKTSDLFRDRRFPHQNEHSLEVQLPFLQRRLGNFKIVPVLINTTNLNQCRRLGNAIAQVVRGHRTLILISTDLSHFPPSSIARSGDRTTLEALESMNLDQFDRTTREEMLA